jgi:hypothetical protein
MKRVDLIIIAIAILIILLLAFNGNCGYSGC